MNNSMLSRRSVRGMSVSTLLVLIIPVLILIAGLAVDGAAQAAGNRRAEIVAATAARAGSDAGAGQRALGRSAERTALQAAEMSLAQHPEVSGQAQLAGAGQISVTTSGSVETVFLSLVGIERLPVSGSATADLYGN